MSKHPTQPVVIDDKGTARFKENKIVTDLLKVAADAGLNLNSIAMRRAEGEYTKDDYSQLMQLIGYSVSGYGNLRNSRCTCLRRADRMVEKMMLHDRGERTA